MTTSAKANTWNEEQSEFNNEGMFGPLDTVNKALTNLDSDTIQPATAIEILKTAHLMLRKIEGVPNLDEFFSQAEPLGPQVLGQILMNHLPHLIDTTISSPQKSYWMAVGEWMGGDWISQFRKAGAFMAKLNEF